MDIVFAHSNSSRKYWLNRGMIKLWWVKIILELIKNEFLVFTCSIWKTFPNPLNNCNANSNRIGLMNSSSRSNPSTTYDRQSLPTIHSLKSTLLKLFKATPRQPKWSPAWGILILNLTTNTPNSKKYTQRLNNWWKDVKNKGSLLIHWIIILLLILGLSRTKSMICIIASKFWRGTWRLMIRVLERTQGTSKSRKSRKILLCNMNRRYMLLRIKYRVGWSK